MNKIFKYILYAFAFLSLAACEGNLDDGAEVPEGTLRIFADKSTISADGSEEVTFRVMFGSQEVTTEKTCQIFRTFDGKKTPMAFGVNKFSTATAGTYKFTAEYYFAGKQSTDNEVEVVAEQYFSGEEKNYKRRYFGTLFTSTGCTYCPISAQGLKDLQAEYPGEISAVAFHSNYNANDPMTIPATAEFNAALGGFTGLPNFFWNMRKESELSGSANKAGYIESFNAEKKAYQTYCGVAVSTKYDNASRKLDVELGITSNLPSVYRYHVILVEDNIPAEGAYAQAGNGNFDGYLHQNAARAVLTSANGDKLNNNLPFNVGVEVKAEKSTTLGAEWNAGNMRVIVTAMTSDDGGYNWTVNNVNECKVGESVSYQYAE